MIHNKKKRLIPVDFLETFKEINFKLQRDVYEFFNEFQDNLENSLLQDKPSHELFTEQLSGEFINEIRFTKCGHIWSNSPEKFIVLSLEVRNMKNIYSALKYFVHWELLLGEPKKCKECGQESPREKRTRIGKWPKQLIIHLKRFQYEKGKFVKLNDGFSFQEKLKVKEGETSLSFNLNGVICHRGSCEYGHYVSLIKKNKKIKSSLGHQDESHHLFKYNFLKRRDVEIKPSMNFESNKWLMYNDDIVVNYSEKKLPKDCFGEFEDVNEYSFEKYKNLTDKNVSESENKMNNKKEELFRDLGGFNETRQRSSSSASNRKSEMNTPNSKSKFNAYVLFFKREDLDLNEVAVSESSREFEESDFKQKIQKDLNRELILEHRTDFFKKDLGFDFVRKLFKLSLEISFSSTSELNFDLLMKSCQLISTYFFDLQCKTFVTPCDSFDESASLILQYLSEKELVKERRERVDISITCSLEITQINTFLQQFSLYILNKVNEQSDSSFDKINPLWSLISSREDLYSNQNQFKEQEKFQSGKAVKLTPYYWVFQILLKSISILANAYSNLTWNDKRIIQNFLKICVKFVYLHKINSSAIVLILEEAFQSKELVQAIFKNGVPGLFLDLIPKAFEQLTPNQTQGWINMNTFFKNNSQTTRSASNIFEYYKNINFCQSSKDSSNSQNPVKSILINRKVQSL
jgi:hypothetical protein